MTSKLSAIIREFQRYVVTKRDVSNPEKLSVFKHVLFQTFLMVMDFGLGTKKCHHMHKRERQNFTKFSLCKAAGQSAEL